MGAQPENRVTEEYLLDGGWGPWRQAMWCGACKKLHSAPLNSLRRIDTVALEQLYLWDGVTNE